MGPTPAAVREQLGRITASATFRNADRASRLLSFLVEENLKDPSVSLKEYRVAVDLFARPESFDPKSDSIVRTAARELRFKLRDFYESEGAGDPILIDLPKGSYVPSYALRQRQAGASGKRLRRLFFAAAVVATAALAGAVLHMLSLAQRETPVTVAVLPFDTLSDAQEDNYMCQGLVDEVTTALANVEGLRVIARTSAAKLKDAPDPVAAARQLKISAVLEGSLRRSGDTYRVSAQLIRTSDGYHQWSRTFVEPGASLPAISTAAAVEIAGALLPRAPARKANPATTVPAKAREQYWRGRYLRRQRPVAAVRQAADAFQSAVESDPKFAAGWAALAEAWSTIAFHQMEAPGSQQAIAKSREAAARAIDLDPSNEEGHRVRAAIHFFHDWDWPAAERDFRRALRLNPSNHRTHYWYALGLLSQERIDEAVAQARMARDLDPLSFTVSNDLGVVYYCARRYDEAVQLARNALATDPNYLAAHALLGCCYSAKRDYAAAIREFETALAGEERFSYLLGRLGHALAASGRRREARAILSKLLERQDSPTLSWVHVAYVYAGLNDTSEALDALEKAIQRRDGDVSFLPVEPLFDPLRSNGNFVRLVQMVNGRR